MTAKQALREIVETLTEEEAEQLLDYLNMLADPDELSPEELERVRLSRESAERGDFITLEEWRSQRAK
jgi:predicted house-cleaning noncanonical NTP pyrophosphatase (MazG superfamily)